MRSPLASPFRGGWRNLTPMRARGRGGVPWSPVALAPYAWYDVHAGGTSTTIADKSGNGRADATYGATTAAPAYLPFVGTAYLHLEAAGTGTNSLSCTAPANTASYAAYPLGGGAATTGAASSGAFTFTTAGDWTQLDLLNGSGTVLASYRASDSGQTGHTDAYSVAWTINRGTAGRKSCLVNTRGLALFGTNDLINVPAAAIPPMLSSSNFTVVVVVRQWSTSVSSGRWFDCRAASPFPGLVFGPSTGTSFSGTLGDGSTTAGPTALTFTYGTRTLAIAAATSAGQTFQLSLNNGTPNTASAATVGTRTGSAATIGRNAPVASGFQDLEFEALLTFSSALSTTEIASLVSYYNAG